jgi:hypothetical protein
MKTTEKNKAQGVGDYWLQQFNNKQIWFNYNAALSPKLFLA